MIVDFVIQKLEAFVENNNSLNAPFLESEKDDLRLEVFYDVEKLEEENAAHISLLKLKEPDAQARAYIESVLARLEFGPLSRDTTEHDFRAYRAAEIRSILRYYDLVPRKGD